MIAYLEGLLAETWGTSCIVVTRGGVGYELDLPAHTMASLPGRGESVALYTSLVVREDAQQLILLLSRYLRYILSFTATTTPLHTEIEQCCNYAELSSVGQNDSVEVVCEIDPELSELPLPPVSLLTLVENSVKHGKMIGKTLKITITAKLLETEEGCMADLSVADNGTGFTAGDLKQLNCAAPQEENGQHVGLFNVVRRLQLLYGEQAAIAFTNNRRGGGARVELFLPIDPVLQKKEGETA
jgi:two-component system sensor histidine kinase YesM